MEPRPVKPPPRSPAAATPNPAYSSGEREHWSPPAAAGAGASYASPLIPPVASYPGPATDPAAARSAWFDPAAPVMPIADPNPKLGYSPGPALTPLDTGRGARILGPLLALVVLAAVVGAVVFVVLRVFGGGDGRDHTLAAADITRTSVAAQAAGSPGAGQPTPSPTVAGSNSAVAGAEETAAPAATKAAGGQTPAAGPAPTTPAAAGGKPTPTPTGAATSARSLLPSSSELPPGFERTEDDKRTKDEVAGSLGNPTEALGLLDQWGWKENAYRTFEIPASSNPDPNSTTYINISIHRFSSKKGASSALTYFSDSVKQSQGLTEITVEKVGDRIVALSGNPDGTANLVVLYIRSGNFLIRIGGSSPSGDPTADVLAVAKKVVGG